MQTKNLPHHKVVSEILNQSAKLARETAKAVYEIHIARRAPAEQKGFVMPVIVTESAEVSDALGDLACQIGRDFDGDLSAGIDLCTLATDLFVAQVYALVMARIED